MYATFKLSLCSLLFAVCACSSQLDTAPADALAPPVTLDSSEIFNLHSEIYSENFRIRVRLPASYAGNLNKRYPVIIKVDGQWDFLLAASVYNCLYFDGQMPETIFVGIDWPDVQGNIHQIRSRDLLPSPIPEFEGSGKASTFIDVLQKEIVPQLSERYRLQDETYLLGGSMGGTFTTYALLERPDFFAGAIAIGGGYEHFEQDFNALIEQHHNSNKLSGKRLYLGVGSHDAIAPAVLRLAEKLEAANLQGFNVKLDHTEGFGHSGMNVPGYAGGYQYMFQRPVEKLDEQTLIKYAGTYALSTELQERLLVSLAGDKLVMQKQGEEPIELLAKSQNEFYHPGIFYQVLFKGNKLIIETFFGVEEFEKISR